MKYLYYLLIDELYLFSWILNKVVLRIHEEGQRDMIVILIGLRRIMMMWWARVHGDAVYHHERDSPDDNYKIFKKNIYEL